MQSKKFSALSLTAAIVATGITTLAAIAPASAETQCQSNHNLGYVDRRLGGVLANLNHDQSDYGGRKAAAMSALSAARGELRAAARVAVAQYGENPSCFRSWANPGGPMMTGDRGQFGSDWNIASDIRWIGSLLDQLNADDRDYNGHKVAAIHQMQDAQSDLRSAEHFARTHGE